MLIKAKAELIQSQRLFLLKNDNCACMEDGSFNLLTAAPICLNKRIMSGQLNQIILILIFIIVCMMRHFNATFSSDALCHTVGKLWIFSKLQNVEM